MSKSRNAGLTLAAGLLCTLPAYGVVETIDAAVTATIEQQLPDGQVNSDLSHENLGESTGNLPLLAEVQLLESGYPDTGGAASARLADPRLATTPDPAEFGLAVLANSTSGPSAWFGSGTAVETRAVTFAPDEIGEPDGTGLEARSFFFLDGILVLWGQPGSTDLSTTAAEVAIRVEQTGESQADPAVVLATSLALVGQADGTALLTTAGQLVPDNVVLLDVTDLVPELGTVQVAILSKLAIPYTYSARVGERFTLAATADARMTSDTGTGAAVILGASAEDLADLLEDVAGPGAGGALAAVLDLHLKAGLVPQRPLHADDTATTVTVLPQSRILPGWLGLPCGAMGAECAAALGVWVGLMGLVRRSRG